MRLRASILVVVALLAVSWIPISESEELWGDYDWPWAWSKEESGYGWWNGTDYHFIRNMTLYYENFKTVTDFNVTFNYRVYRYGGVNYTYPDDFPGEVIPRNMRFFGLNGSGNLSYQFHAIMPDAINRTHFFHIYYDASLLDYFGGVQDILYINVPLRLSINIKRLNISPSKPVNGEKVAVTAIINNSGNGRQNIRIELYVDGQPEQLLFKDIDYNTVESYTLFWTAETGYREIDIKVRNSNNATLASEKSEKVLVRHLSPAAWANIYIGLGTVLFLAYIRFHFRRAAKRL